MRGEYRYVVLTDGQSTATEQQISDNDNNETAELGTFHFIFPEDQRVKPFRTEGADDEEEDEDDDDDEPVAKASSSVSGKSSTSSSVVVDSLEKFVLRVVVKLSSSPISGILILSRVTFRTDSALFNSD